MCDGVRGPISDILLNFNTLQFILADPTTGAVAPKPKRDKKEPFKIDFFTPSTKSQKEIIKEIFAPVGKGGSITLPHASSSKTSSKKTKSRKSKDKTRRIEQTLPDDMHFSSRQLVTLFLKPKFAVSTCRLDS